METIKLIGEMLIFLGGGVGIFSIMLVLWIFPSICHDEDVIEETMGISLILMLIFFGFGLLMTSISEDNKTLIKIESSSDYNLYYDKETHIVYSITDKTTTPLYNTDGSFKTYTED